MNIAEYLRRIGGPTLERPGYSLLCRLLRAHVTSVPFENLDVQLGRRLTTDIEAAWDKIVARNRGGWCYEQNGLFGWALSEIGFDVTRVAAGVMRHERGTAADANHLCLLVRAPDAGDEVWLADVGFGGSLLAPLPLTESTATHVPYRLVIEELSEGQWRFSQDSGSGPFSYDFRTESANEGALAAKSLDLQTDPESSFVLNLVAQLRRPTEHLALRGRVLTRTSADGKTEHLLNSADELVGTLGSTFGLDVPAVGDLWPRILARHDDLFGAD